MKSQCDVCGREFSDKMSMTKIPDGIILPMKNEQSLNLCIDCFLKLGSEEGKAMIEKLSEKFDEE